MKRNNLFVLGFMITVCLFAYWLTADAGNIEKNPNQESTAGTADTTAWIDLSGYGNPEKIVWALKILSCNMDTAHLRIDVQTSDGNSDKVEDYAYKITHFNDGTSYYDSIFSVADADTGKTYHVILPRPGYKNLSDSTWALKPLPPPGRFIRLIFTSSGAAEKWTYFSRLYTYGKD